MGLHGKMLYADIIRPYPTCVKWLAYGWPSLCQSAVFIQLFPWIHTSEPLVYLFIYFACILIICLF